MCGGYVCSLFCCALVLVSPRFFKKSEGNIVIASVRPSVRLSVRPSDRLSVMLSPPKPLDEIQPNLVCELLTWMGRATSNFFFGPAPWGPWEGSKGQILFNLNYKVNFKDFYTKLCVCSHKWKIQTISDGIFILSPRSCPRGGTLGRWGCPGVIFFQTWSCGISNRRGWQAEQHVSKIFILGLNWWPWGEV